MLVQTNTARTQSNNEQETANDRHGLEEVVLEEVVKRFVRVYGPERVAQDVHDGENDDERERAELGLVADGDEDNECAADHVEEHVQEGEVDANERQEHDDEQDAADELEVVFGRVVVQGWHAGEQALGVWAVLDEQQDQAACQ